MGQLNEGVIIYTSSVEPFATRIKSVIGTKTFDWQKLCLIVWLFSSEALVYILDLSGPKVKFVAMCPYQIWISWSRMLMLDSNLVLVPKTSRGNISRTKNSPSAKHHSHIINHSSPKPYWQSGYLTVTPIVRYQPDCLESQAVLCTPWSIDIVSQATPSQREGSSHAATIELLHGRKLMWPIRSALFVDHTCCQE